MPCTEEHEALQSELHEIRQLVENHQRAEAQIVRDTVDEVMTRHLAERHHPPLNAIAQELGKSPTDLMGDFIQAVSVSSRMVDALDGPMQKHGVSGVESRDFSKGLIGKVDALSNNQMDLIAGQKDLKAELKNGIKHKLEISKLQYTLAGTVIITLGGILVALLSGG